MFVPNLPGEDVWESVPKRRRTVWTPAALCGTFLAALPAGPLIREPRWSAQIWSLGVEKTFIDPALDWPLVNRAACVAPLRTRDCPLVALGRRDPKISEEYPYALYAARWPARRHPKTLAHLVQSIRRLDAAGLEVCWIHRHAALRLSWSEGLLPALRKALSDLPRVARTLRMQVVKAPFTATHHLLAWRAADGLAPGPRPHVASKWLKGLRFRTFKTPESLAKATPPFLRQVAERTERPTDCYWVTDRILLHASPDRFADHIQVRATDAESETPHARESSVCFDYERSFRDVAYAMFALDPGRDALVMLGAPQRSEPVAMIWFSLRDAYLGPLTSAMFGSRSEGVEHGIVDLVCDYAGVTQARPDR